jgi:peptidoglycan/LPS O-acetylase OafA/YrhL
MKDTFGSTNSLKGIAIFAVLINHYLNLNLTGDYLWFANLFVGLFFIVSGYGIFCSLERSAAAGPLRFRDLGNFYFSRLIRIYPLFITAYLIQCYLFDEPVISWTIFAIHGRGHYWFIPAIIQCYLLAPLLFFLIKRYRFLTLNIVVFVFLAANLMLHTGMLPAANNSIRFIHLQWRDVYFLYLLLFTLSMYLPHYLASWEQIPGYEKKYWFILLLTTVLTVMIVFKYLGSTDYLYILLTGTICPLLLLCLAAVYLLANRLQFPLLTWIGKISYPVYLFHVIMYRSVDQFSGLGKNSLQELLIVIVVLPLFFYCCSLIDRWNNSIIGTLRLTYSRITNRQPV